MDEPTKKNFAVLQEAFNHMDRRLNDQQIEIRGLQSTVVMLRTQLQENTQQLQVLRTITRGNGPTVRS